MNRMIEAAEAIQCITKGDIDDLKPEQLAALHAAVAAGLAVRQSTTQCQLTEKGAALLVREQAVRLPSEEVRADSLSIRDRLILMGRDGVKYVAPILDHMPDPSVRDHARFVVRDEAGKPRVLVIGHEVPIFRLSA